MTNKIFTRADRLANKCTHHEYFMQFADRIPKQVLLNKHTIEEWKDLYDKDEHLNNVPLIWWDELAPFMKKAGKISFKDVGADGYSKSDIVCTAKAKVKHMIDES